MKNKLITRPLLLIIVVIVFLSACRGSNSGDKTGSGTNITQDSGTLGSSGGIIEVTDAASPIKGTKVVVPDGAIGSGEKVDVAIKYTDVLPGAIPKNDAQTIAVSKVFILTKSSSSDFKVPVDVTIPYADAKLQTGDIPCVAYWDDTMKKYMPVTVKAIDRTNKLVTFSTVHFSFFVALAIPGLTVAAEAASLLPADTGFKPDVDGFYHPNTNVFEVGLGSCVGMSTYAAWYFAEKKGIDGAGLYSKYRQGNPNLWADDFLARQLLTRAAVASSQTWASILAGANLLTPFEAGIMLLQAMKIWNEPQVMAFNYKLLERHAVTVYRYDNVKSQFHIYDSNYPGQDVTVDWSPTWGLSNYSAPPPNTTTISNYTFIAFPSYFKGQVFEEFYQGAKSNWSGSKFNVITMSSPVLDANDFAIVTKLASDDVTIQGIVSGGVIPAKYLGYKVIKATTGSVEASGLVILATDGSFSFKRNLGAGIYWIALVATDHATDAANLTPHMYAGLKEMWLTVNISSPPTLSVLGSLSLPNPAMNVQVVGNLAYIRDYRNGLRVVDVSNPAAPTLKGAADINYLSTGNGLYVNSPYAYVGSGAFYIVDVSNPLSPFKLSSQGFNANAGDLVVAGTNAYIAAGRYTFQSVGLFAIVDIKDPTNTAKNRYVGGLEFTGGNIRAIAMAGGYAYLVDTSNSMMYVVNVLDPANPVKKAEMVLPSLAANSNCSIFLSGDKAYIADAAGFSIINISMPESPSKVIHQTTPEYMKDVWVSGTRAYFLSTSKLFIYDVTDPIHPSLTTSVDLPSSTVGTGLFVAGSTAYVTQETSDSKGMLTIIDLGK